MQGMADVILIPEAISFVPVRQKDLGTKMLSPGFEPRILSLLKIRLTNLATRALQIVTTRSKMQYIYHITGMQSCAMRSIRNAIPATRRKGARTARLCARFICMHVTGAG